MFPIVVMLIILFYLWLGILGPLPGGVSAWIAKWQLAWCRQGLDRLFCVSGLSSSIDRVRPLESALTKLVVQAGSKLAS